ADQHDAEPVPGRRRQAGRDPGQPRLRHPLHRPHAHGRVDPRAGLARRPHHGVRADLPRSRDSGAALRAGDLRGDEGLPARGRLDLDLPSRPERRADGPLVPAARVPGAAGRGLRRLRRRAGRGRPAVGAPELDRGGRRREVALPAALHVRLGVLPGRQAGAARHLHGDRLAGGCLFQGRCPPGHALAVGDVHPRGSGRDGCREDRRQLRRIAGRPARGHRAGLRPGRLPRRPGVPLHRGARRDEPVLRPRRRPHRDPGDRDDPGGHHPGLDHRARRQARLPRRGAEVLDRRVARRRGERRDHRDLRLRHRSGRHAGRGAQVPPRRRPGTRPDRPHHAHPRGPGRHAVRPRRGQLRLAAPGLL
ncbi:MAG: Branched-chain amino acid aminotransferase, partial [uncultured Nocardioides sp.]